MSNWRDSILKEFTPKIAKLTLVADPDGLLLEEGILKSIRERGFELIPFEDHIVFRYAYESKFRSRWDRGEHTELVVVLHSPEENLNTLPYDLLRSGRQLSFSLGDIFPNLSYPVLAELDRSDLDALYPAQQKYNPGKLGDNATKDFILRHVFGIASELIKTPVDLLRVLLHRHYNRQNVPFIFDEWFIRILNQSEMFDDWPLDTIVPDREAFFAFLQERWPIYLNQLASQNNIMVRESPSDHAVAYPGPKEIPFDHSDIRIYIDNLFMEGMLTPVPHKYAIDLDKTWAETGIYIDREKEQYRRLQNYITDIQTKIPGQETQYHDWLQFGRRWGQFISLIYKPNISVSANIKEEYQALQGKIDNTFTTWLLNHYPSLINLPPSPPVMLHHIPRHLLRFLDNRHNSKVALLLIDGLSLDQWTTISNAIKKRNKKLLVRENAVFAWMPTITSVSRQAAFSGKAPMYYPDSISTTNKESRLWKQFWLNEGLRESEIVYVKGINKIAIDDISDKFAHKGVKVLGMVIDTVDKIMHGMELGTSGMHNQILQWTRENHLLKLFDLLLENGFNIFLTSDHGNIEATGCGSPAEGAIADLRGQRVRIYSDESLRDKVYKQFPNSLKWQSVGLPEDYLALTAPHRKAFVRDGEPVVSHGGISIEEIIVPFVQIERKSG